MMEMKKEDAFARLQLSITRAGTTYQLSDVTKEDVPKAPRDLVRSIWGAALKMRENTAQLSTNTNAAQAVANAAAIEAAAGAATREPHDVARNNVELKLEQLSISTTAAQTVDNAAAEKAAASATALERATSEQTVAIDADEQAAAITAEEAAAIATSLHWQAPGDHPRPTRQLPTSTEPAAQRLAAAANGPPC